MKGLNYINGGIYYEENCISQREKVLWNHAYTGIDMVGVFARGRFNCLGDVWDYWNQYSNRQYKT
jgi:hypothetical protein